MPSTVGEIKTLVLNKMREYSNGGEIISIGDNRDYILSLVPLINLYQQELCVDVHKIHKDYEISMDMPISMLGEDQWYEREVHKSGETNIFTVTGARAFSIMVQGPYELFLEEETAEDTWTELNSWSGIGVDSRGYVNIKGLVNASDVAHRVRLRLSGDYRYLYRYVGFFEDLYETDEDVPTYEPWVGYEMDSDFYILERIDVTTAIKQYTDYSVYRVNKTDKTKKVIYLPYGLTGEVTINYYAYPTKLEIPAADNLSAIDDVEIDIPDEGTPALVHRIASTLIKDENAYMADSFEEEYLMAKQNVESESDSNHGIQGIIDNTGGW